MLITDPKPKATNTVDATRPPIDLETAQTAIIFSNIVEMVGNVVSSISTTDVQNAVNKDNLNTAVLNGLVANRIIEVVKAAKRL